MNNNSLNLKISRYVQGGITEEGPIGIEWWDRFIFPLDDSDIEYIVNENVQGRLDLIADYFLKDPQLWWLIAQYNNILDAHLEIVTGRILYIPTVERVQLFLSQRNGGIPSTRGKENILPPIVL